MRLIEELRAWSKEFDAARWQGDKYDVDMVEISDLLEAAASRLERQSLLLDKFTTTYSVSFPLVD
jgi:hypothetical protein